MLKKLVLVGMVLFTLNIGSANVSAATNDIKVIVDGKSIVSDVAPVLDKSSGRVLVPMRAIFEALGYNVEWDTVTETAIAKLEKSTSTTTASVQPDSQTLKVGYQDWLKAEDKKSSLDNFNTDFYFMLPLDNKNPVKTINGRVMLPTRMISESVGAKVEWNGTTKVVTINTANAKIVAPKGWEKAISDNYKAISPDYYYIAGYDYEGAYNYDFTFNGVKGGKIETVVSKPSTEVEVKSTRTPVIVLSRDGMEQDITPVDTVNGTIYKTYDMLESKIIEYSYKKPQVTRTEPIVGSFPAKILIDESIKTVSYYKDPNGNLEDYKNVIMNLELPYSVSLLSLGGCNWYAEARFWEVTGIPIPHFRESKTKKFWKTEEYLNVADQYDELLALRDVNDVQSNSIALFTSATTSHVLFVEYVERDSQGKPMNVYFTEANLGGNGKYRYGVDGKVNKLSFEDFKSRSASGNKYQGCIIANSDFYK